MTEKGYMSLVDAKDPRSPVSAKDDVGQGRRWTAPGGGLDTSSSPSLFFLRFVHFFLGFLLRSARKPVSKPGGSGGTVSFSYRPFNE